MKIVRFVLRYDNAINSAMRKLRAALGDTSESTRFIETLARRGYRFVGHIETARTEKAPEKPFEVEPVATEALSQKRKISQGALIGGMLLAVGGTAAWLVLRPNPVSDIPMTSVPLTAAAGFEGSSSFSPDGNQLVYAWDETGKGPNSHIYRKMIGSGRPVGLTNGQVYDYAPAWSPDGRNVAFLRAMNPRTGVYSISALGGAERKLVDGYFSGPVSWSPDGRFLAAAEGNPASNASSLCLIAAESGEKFRLTSPDDGKARDGYPAFSPDGRTLLFARCIGWFHCSLYLLDLTSNYRAEGQPRMLRQENGGIEGTAWTSDGKEAIYALSGDAAYNYQLMRVRTEVGAQPRRISFVDDQSLFPVTAKRGHRLAYTHDLGDADLWQVQPGKQPRSFVSSTREEDSPQYSPQGTRIAFSSSRSGLMQVWVCDQDGNNPVQLTHFDTGPSGTPRWSPDGKWITFDHQQDGVLRILVMASDGGQVRRLTPESSDQETIPSWSGDGKWIYYSCNRSGRFEVWKAPAQGGKGSQVTHNGGVVAFESRDEKSLYYTKDESPQLWALPLAGGNEKAIVDYVDGRAFAVVEDGIYYIGKGRRDTESSIYFYRFAIGKSEEIVPLQVRPYSVGMTVSPDSKTIVFPVQVRTGSNIIVVDNFR